MIDMPHDRIQLLINGDNHDIEDIPGQSLLHVLRDRLGLTGTKEACGRGECGACTVLIAGTPHLSCLTLAARVRGEVLTIEGIAEKVTDLREAFADFGGFQCGFCTSGQLVQATALLSAGLPDDRAEAERAVRHGLSGNICRCTGYAGIVEAVLRVAARRAESSIPS